MKGEADDERTLRVASVQFESMPGDKDANFQKIETFVEQAARQNVRLIVFPECCLTGYWFIRNLSVETLTQLAEPIFDGPSSQRLIDLAKKVGMSIGAGLVEAGPAGEFYNSYVVAMADGSAQRHRKLHAFEHPSVRSGSEFTVFDIPDGFRVGTLICYDCNIIENVRLTALRGAEILIAPHQTGGCRSRNPHLMGVIDRRIWDERHTNPAAIERELRGDKGRGWLMRWLPSRAHDNGLFLIFSNGVGVDDDEIRTGNAMILDPYGRILAETWKAGDDMVIADLDASLLAEKHRSPVDSRAPAPTLRTTHSANRAGVRHAQTEVRGVKEPMQIEFRNTIRRLGAIVCAAAMLLPLSAGAADEPAGPLSPKQERASFQLANDALTIDPVAAEPDVVSPVAIAFDADGRLFVAEMLDYPNAQTSGRIRLLEDRDGDGRYETTTVFADKLPFPNGVLPWRGGVLVTAAPDIWYLSDTNGDGRADERRVLFTGFGLGNQQLRVNGLTWGLDNWVYGANGRSEGDIRRPDDSPGKTTSIRGHDFRFRPDTGEFEVIAGRSQFGLARDDWGNRFLSWNTIPIRHEVLPERYLNRNPQLAETESIAGIIEPGDTGRVFPLAPPPLTFNNESVKNFNALSGLTIFRAGGLGEEYRGNAFVGESLLNLVHRRVLEPDGVTFVARRREREKEFLASTDPWFHPVNFATGPDGALYVVDFYRKFVEHPDWVHGAARNEVPWRTGAGHGRIWRVRSSKSSVSNRKVNLTRAAWPDLVGHLRDDNGWWRDTAQRLLVERQERLAIPALEKLVQQTSSPLARLHALCALDGLRALTPDVLLTALGDSQPEVREQALRLSEGFLANQQFDRLRPAVAALAEDPDARVRFQVALSLGEFDGAAKLDALAKIARRDFAGHWHRLAVLSSVGSNAWPLLRKLAGEEPAWLNAPTGEQTRFLDQAARLVGANHSDAELKDCLTLLTQPAAKPLASGHLALLAGLADGLSRTPHPLRELMNNPPDAIKRQIQSLGTLVDIAITRAASPQENIPARLGAIRFLARVTPGLSGAALLDLLQAQQPAEVQSAAARALAELNTDALARDIFARWSQYAAATRRRVLAAIPRSTAMSAALADALERGNLPPVELDASLRQSLLKSSSEPLKQRFERLLATAAAPDRQDVVARFQAAVKLEGDRPRGAAIFAKTCLLCHTVEGQGRNVGPDLSGIASRPKEALLVDILDPSRQVSPDFINYTLVRTDGTLVSGLIVSETAVGATLRRAGEADDTILHSQIKELRAEGKSLMPEGLEQGLVPQDMADLLSFLQKPEGRLLPEAK